MKKKTIIICVSLLLFIMGVAASAVYLILEPGFVYRVYLDGKEVGTVEDLERYSEILSGLLVKEEAKAGLSLAIVQDVVAQREFQWQPQDDSAEVRAALETNLTYTTIGWGIVVDDECLAWTATRKDAQEVLNRVASHYVTESSNCELVCTEIIDDVDMISQEVLPEDIIDVDSATALIIQGKEKIETYVVSRGDSVWSIARSANISQAELKEANPSLPQNNILHAGETLNLVKAEPKVSVRTVEKVFVNESIPFSTSYQRTSGLWYYQSKTTKSGVRGQRQVTYEVEYINGEETSRKTLDSQIKSKPVSAVVQRGTSRWPSGAKGMFRWPLKTGKITDYFGRYRLGSRHRGVDIGAPGGTPIYAAASGTVSTATSSGSYGKYVVIQHEKGYSTLYAHASSLNVGVGQWVSKGQLIAWVGSTGVSTGNHLHFEIRRHGASNPINPLQFFRP